VGKVHCGKNACILVGRCEENTHICTNDTLWGSALWGKSVRPSWRCGENTHTHTHTGRDSLVGLTHEPVDIKLVVARTFKQCRITWEISEDNTAIYTTNDDVTSPDRSVNTTQPSDFASYKYSYLLTKRHKEKRCKTIAHQLMPGWDNKFQQQMWHTSKDYVFMHWQAACHYVPLVMRDSTKSPIPLVRRDNVKSIMVTLTPWVSTDITEPSNM